MLLLTTLIFLAVTLGLTGLFFWLAPTRTEQRLKAMAGPVQKSNWTEKVVKVAGPFAKLSAPEGDWENSPLRLHFFHAGIRHPDARLIYFGAKTLLPLGLAALAFTFMRSLNQTSGVTLLFYVLLFALIGVYLPNLLLHLKLRDRQREIFENF